MSILSFEESNGHLKIAVPWFVNLFFYRVGITALLIVGCLVSGAILASSLGIVTSEEDTRSVGAFFFSSTSFFACIYVATAFWRNRTILDVTSDDISVYTDPFPLPWRRKYSFATAGISQLFVQEVQNISPTTNTGHVSSYQVWVLLESGERKVLLDFHEVTGTLSKSKTPASTIEERIESFLGIENVPVEKRIVTAVHAQPPPPAGGCS